ncbi:aminotransferase class V-fold PLP-dependent enzyme [Ascidiaceihabitans sp.]|nr:aminotransferase class V-fold PLP-dependent enzyme [Ascidiaceihabitans sp.]
MSDLTNSCFQVKNYIVGPVNPYPRTMEIRAQSYPYFRTKNFSKTNKYVAESLNILLNVNDQYHSAMITGSGTLGMEIAALNFTAEDDDVLVISSGSFGERFVEILTNLKCRVEKITVNFDQNLSQIDLERLQNSKKYKAVFVNHHETSTGHLHDLALLRNFCDKNGALLIADCMTSFLSDNRRDEMCDCDVIITSSHKGMCCSPGLVFVTYKNKILEQAKRERTLPSYVDLNTYKESIKTGQTPYTPAIGVILELADMFKMIRSIGYDDWLNQVKKRAQYFRSIISAEWTIPKHELSNFMTPILLPKNSNMTVKSILSNLSEIHGVEITPIGGPYRNKMLRISHVGNHTISETSKLAKYLNSKVSKNG